MKKKQMVITLILIFAMAMTVTACGKENDADEPATVGSVIDIEDIMEEIPTEDVEEETNNSEIEVPTESEEVNTQSEEAINSETNTNAQVNQQPAEAVAEPPEEQQPAEQPKEQPTEQPKEPAEQQVQESIEQSVPTATLNGRIISIGNGEFSIVKANVINSNVMVSKEDAEEVSIIYTDKTEFVLCTTSDGGRTADYSQASSSSLTSDRMVEIQGAFEGNSFMAQKITIFNF